MICDTQCVTHKKMSSGCAKIQFVSSIVTKIFDDFNSRLKKATSTTFLTVKYIKAVSTN